MTRDKIKEIILKLETLDQDSDEYWDISIQLDATYFDIIKLLLSECERLESDNADWALKEFWGETMKCPKCESEMKEVIFDGYGGGLQCPNRKCKHQILMEDNDSE